MNKKYLVVFGLMGLFAVAIVSAVLVPYLSDPVAKDIAVASPLNLTIEEFVVVTPYDFKNQTIDFTLENNAVVPVYTIVETSITGTNDDGAVEFNSTNVGEEFAILKIGLQLPGEVYCIEGGGIDWDIDGENYCYWDASTDKAYSGVVEGVYYVQMGDGSVPIEAKQTMNGRMKLQFDTAVEPATYTFTTEAVTVDGAKDLS